MSPDGKWTQLTHFSDRITQGVFGKDQAIYAISEGSSPRGTVLRLPLAHPSLADAATIVPAAEDVVQGILPTTRRLSYLDPPAWFRFDSASGKAERASLFMKPAADFSDAEVVREFATSRDGTKVPINIIRRKGTNGNNPTHPRSRDRSRGNPEVDLI